MLIVTQYFSPELVGTAFYTRDAAEWFSSRGWDVRVLTGEPHYPDYQRFPGHETIRRREQLGHVRVRRLRSYIASKPSPFTRLLAQLLFLVHTCRLRLIGRSHACVLAFSPGMFAVLAARMWRARHGTLITIVHDVESGLAASTGQLPEWMAAALRGLEAWIYNRSDVVACLSKQMADTLAEIGVDEGRLEIVPVWLREELFDLSLPPPAPPESPVVMYSGALGRKQGLDLLIDVADALARRTDAHMVVRGAGPGRPTLEEACVRRQNISVGDLVAEEELQQSLASATLHVVPQEPNGAAFSVPSKLLNILAAGRPVVARAAAGSPIADLALACPAVHVAATAEEVTDVTVNLLRTGEGLADLGASGRDYVLRNHSKARCLGTIESIYLERGPGTHRDKGAGRSLAAEHGSEPEEMVAPRKVARHAL